MREPPANITNAGVLPRWHVEEVTILRLSKGLCRGSRRCAPRRQERPCQLRKLTAIRAVRPQII